jgi:putative flippase GtrA
MKTLAREAVGYAAASGCALIVDMTTLWILVHFLSWGYMVAAVTSYFAGAVVAYELSIKLAFKHHRLEDRRGEFASFVAIGTLGVAVNAAVIFVMVKYAGLHFLIAKGIAAGCTFFCNFVARRQILFSKYSSVP